jgi:hypothetical protein
MIPMKFYYEAIYKHNYGAVFSILEFSSLRKPRIRLLLYTRGLHGYVCGSSLGFRGETHRCGSKSVQHAIHSLIYDPKVPQTE